MLWTCGIGKTTIPRVLDISLLSGSWLCLWLDVQTKTWLIKMETTGWIIHAKFHCRPTRKPSQVPCVRGRKMHWFCLLQGKPWPRIQVFFFRLKFTHYHTSVCSTACWASPTMNSRPIKLKSLRSFKLKCDLLFLTRWGFCFVKAVLSAVSPASSQWEDWDGKSWD